VQWRSAFGTQLPAIAPLSLNINRLAENTQHLLPLLMYHPLNCHHPRILRGKFALSFGRRNMSYHAALKRRLNTQCFIATFAAP